VAIYVFEIPRFIDDKEIIIDQERLMQMIKRIILIYGEDIDQMKVMQCFIDHQFQESSKFFIAQIAIFEVTFTLPFML